MQPTRLIHILLGLIMFGFLAACDSFFTGEKVVSFDLTPQADGGYAPLTVSLGPEMNTVALNFRAEIPPDPTATNKWNEYAVVLTFKGETVASGQFNVNDTGTADAPGTPFIARTAIIHAPKETGDYQITISAKRKPVVTILKPQIELRRNIVAPKK